MKLKCSTCQLIAINGIPFHEHGCPRHHIDPTTDLPYLKECKWCGSEFQPEDKEECCSNSCCCAYNGLPNPEADEILEEDLEAAVEYFDNLIKE